MDTYPASLYQVPAKRVVVPHKAEVVPSFCCRNVASTVHTPSLLRCGDMTLVTDVDGSRCHSIICNVALLQMQRCENVVAINASRSNVTRIILILVINILKVPKHVNRQS